MDTRREAASFRNELGRLEQRGRERAYPEALRRRAIAYVKARRAEGAATRTAGDEIGMDWRTLLRWAPRAHTAAFERVLVRDDAPVSAVMSSLVVHGPRGIRIEGLDLAGVVELVRRLGWSARRARAVYAYRTPVDMRKSFDTLTALVVQGLGRDVLSGDLFLFISKRRRRAKVLFWDGAGLCLYAKRLEKGLFAAPRACTGDGPLSMTMTELQLLLEGSALVTKVPLSPMPWSPADRVLCWD